MGNEAATCYNRWVPIISEASRDQQCPCGADPRPNSPFCSTDCEPDYVADPDDPWGFIRVPAADEHVQDDRLDPWLTRA